MDPPAEDDVGWSNLQDELSDAPTPAPAPPAAAPARATSKPSGTSESAAAVRPKAKKKKKSAKRRAKDRPAEASGQPPKKSRKKRRKHKGDPRLSGVVEATVEATAAPEPTATTPTRPVLPPVHAPPVFGEAEPEDEPVVAEAPRPAPAPEPEPEPTPEVPTPAEATQEAPRPRPRRPGDDTLAWVVLPKVDALLAQLDEALADEGADRATLLGVRKAVQRDWAALRPLPREHADRLESARKEKLAPLDARIDALPDPRALEEAANVAARTEIVEAAEALADHPDLGEALDRGRTLRDIWRTAGRVPREQHRHLNERWRAAFDALYARRDAQRAERADQLRGLVKRAEGLTTSTDPKRAAEAMKGLQARWKAVGGIGRGEEADALWTAFRAAADTVFARRREARDAEEQQNLASKEALVAEAHALHGTELGDVDEVVKRLHQRWRRIGHVPRDRSDAVWAAFKAACDRLHEPPAIDDGALGDGEQTLSFSPFAAALARPGAAPPDPADVTPPPDIPAHEESDTD